MVQNELPIIAASRLATTAQGPVMSLVRSDTAGTQPVSVAAYDDSGSSLASARGEFAPGENTTEVAFNVPEAVQSQMAWFSMIDHRAD